MRSFHEMTTLFSSKHSLRCQSPDSVYEPLGFDTFQKWQWDFESDLNVLDGVSCNGVPT